MAVNVSITKYFVGNGPIRFSELRDNFIRQKVKSKYSDSVTYDSSLTNVKASHLKRDVNVTTESPIVPDCNTNRICGVLNTGISSENNLGLSQFRGSVKYVYANQTGTDVNLNLSKLSTVTNVPIDSSVNDLWQDNLYDSNIKKVVYIDGICGSTTSFYPALSVSPEYFVIGAGNTSATGVSPENTEEINNITVRVMNDGKIYGAGGDWNLNSGRGGNALNMNSVGESKNNIVQVEGQGRIWAGGSSGVTGNAGNAGSSNCNQTLTYNDGSGGGCVSNPGRNCNAGYNGSPEYNPCGKNCSGNPCRSWNLHCVKSTNNNYTSSASGGGNGGPGRGYLREDPNNFPLTGGPGNTSPAPPCPANYTTVSSSNGNAGGQGGTGAEWGEPEIQKTEFKSLGGEAISGNIHKVLTVNGSPEIDTSPFKGRYIP